MNLDGMLIGALAFCLIGIFHPIVIWAEYYFSSRCWPVFLIFGLGFLIVSGLIANTLLSVTLGITGVSCLWSILELKEQEKRVAKGWFPKLARTEKPKQMEYKVF